MPQKQKQKQLAGRQLEALVLERLEPPEQVAEFKRFEELAKLFDIEQPAVPRTQLELLFDVYDGKKLRQPFGSLDESDGQAAAAAAEGATLQTGANLAKLSIPASASVRRSSFAASQQQQAATTAATKLNQQVGAAHKLAGRGRMSWCRLLFARRKLACCLKPSDTHQELGLLSGSSSLESGDFVAASGSGIVRDFTQALEPTQEDDFEACEVKREARALVERALANAKWQTSGTEQLTCLATSAGLASAALALESAQMESSGECVSICLLDKRRCGSLTTRQLNQLDREQVNGRAWARAANRLAGLRRRLRQSALAGNSNLSSASGARELKRVARKASHKFWSEWEREKRRSLRSTGIKKEFEVDKKKCEPKLDAEQLEQLVELVKGSLNQLIDAQLLLRNKLALNGNTGVGGAVSETSSLLAVHHMRSAEYEQLLRDNFNLLKIWQNLEETRRLVCFVCEPIRANLADLFAFSCRQRSEWPPASHFDWNSLNGNTQPGASNAPTAGPHLLVSPLVCLDAVQVKRGLLQILEALNFLHAICKLIHRNLTPRNILIGQLDNWKLAGLEFALRFESTTISESASMLAHEFSHAIGPMLAPAHLMATSATSATAAGETAAGMSHAYASTSAHNQAPSSSGGACTGTPLRRQRTLHQTKCQEFIKVPKCRLLQPDLDYLAPEIWRSSKCSHKSDLFSFGLILGQTYDLGRHKSPLACHSQAANYESELKRLDKRRKLTLARRVPAEFKTLLVEMLDTEPHLRPSANHVLQTLKRPVEMCRSSEASLKHLRNSLAYLDDRPATSGAGGATTEQATDGTPTRRRNYFKRVTSAAANREPAGRLQTHNLQLLNQLVRALEAATPAGSGRHSFGGQRALFEQTLELLGQVCRWTGELGAQADGQEEPLDARVLLLIVALHRRLLEQVGAMRAELPPLCGRLTATSAGMPFDRSLASPSHRALADAEERLQMLISRHSLGRLAEWLADPLLKLDEFLLVFELISDLLAFVGQRCRLNYRQRGKQLLQELTPFAGGAALSSSDEDEDEDEEPDELQIDCQARRQLELDELDEMQHQHQNQNRHHSYEPPARPSSQSMAQTSGCMSAGGEMRQQAASNSRPSSRASSRQRQQQQQLFQLPTSINIVAPSPIGSVRDISRASLASSTNTMTENSLASGTGQSPCGRFQQPSGTSRQQPTNIKRHSQQDVTTSSADLLAQQTSQMSLSDGGGGGGGGGAQQHRRSIAATPTGQERAAIEGHAAAPDEKSRSKLIDELLKTINDDSFNDFIDFNNKLNAGSRAAATSELELINAQRPKSAMGTIGSGSGSSAGGGGGASGNSSQPSGDTTSRPRTLNLNSSNLPSAGSQRASRYQTRGSICVPSGQQQPASTFDNVIRRMSTNLVQNFNKMSGSTLGAGGCEQESSLSNTNLRREKSHTSTYANSLYVDTSQVPARRHSDNTINVPRIQVALSSPSSAHSGSRTNLNQRASVSASKLANKWKLSTKTNQREASDKLSPNLGGALGYMRRHSSGNTTNGNGASGAGSAGNATKSDHHHQQGQSNGSLGASLMNSSPFKQTKSSSNLGLDFLISNRSMKRRCSAASMLGHQTQRKAEDLLDAGMKSVQNMFS